MRLYTVLLLVLIVAACEPEEIPIDPIPAGSTETVEIEMGSDYNNQLYYQLSSNSVIAQNDKTEWELGFENGSDGWHVILNDALFTGVKYIDEILFDATVQPDTFTWKYDVPSGNIDSTAFGNWKEAKGFYVLNLGVNATGNTRGYMRIRFESVNQSTYQIRVASMDMSVDTTLVVPKNETTNFTALSISNLSVVEIEPDKDEWDLHFTQYTHIFHDPPMGYSVTGVLLNPNGVRVAEPNIAWEDIEREDVNEYEFSTKEDFIGYDWKYFDFDSGLYTVDSHRNFVIHSSDGYYYKMRFVDFYNSSGEKGYPQMEIERM